MNIPAVRNAQYLGEYSQEFGNRQLNDAVGLDPADRLDDVVTAAAAMPLGVRLAFDGAEFLASILNREADILTSATPRDLDYRYDVRLLAPYTRSAIKGSRYEFCRLAALSKASCRSLGVRHAARIHEYAILDSGNIKELNTQLLFWRDDSYVPKEVRNSTFLREKGEIVERQRFSRTDMTHMTMKAKIALGVAFSHHFLWGVLLGIPGRRVRVSCYPSAIREFFSARDVGPSGRRQALRNWVKGHWRRKRTPEEEAEAKTWVRKHLRGKTAFGWNGIDCEISVAPADLREVRELAAARLA